jgi:hypothetical protein
MDQQGGHSTFLGDRGGFKYQMRQLAGINKGDILLFQKPECPLYSPQANVAVLKSVLSDSVKVRNAFETNLTNFTIQYDPHASVTVGNANAAIRSATMTCRNAADML